MGTSFSFTETLIKVLVYTKWKSLKSFQKNLKNACFLLWSSSLLIFLTTLGKNELERFHINRLLKARKITTHDGPGSWRRLLNWNDASRFTVSNFQSRLTTSSNRTSSFRLHICVYQVNLLWLSWQNVERNYKIYLRESAAKRTRITQRIFSTKKSLT